MFSRTLIQRAVRSSSFFRPQTTLTRCFTSTTKPSFSSTSYAKPTINTHASTSLSFTSSSSSSLSTSSLSFRSTTTPLTFQRHISSSKPSLVEPARIKSPITENTPASAIDTSNGVTIEPDFSYRDIDNEFDGPFIGYGFENELAHFFPPESDLDAHGHPIPKIKVTFVSMDGEKKEVEAKVGLTLLEVARKFEITSIPAYCNGGGCGEVEYEEGAMCRYCHVFVDPVSVKKLPPKTFEEDYITMWIKERNQYTRFACEIVLTPELDGLTVVIPNYKMVYDLGYPPPF